jgi:hypothetical protein
MALPNVNIPADQWVDLYAESGATAGNALIVQNLSNHVLRISYDDVEPTDLSSFFNAQTNQFIGNQAGEGFWAYSHSVPATVAVAEA